ncbi:MAG: S-layer homology domain-containing protein [Oscillospiraceae bacterium]|nr:S-layer homology domain-containing protein [Oscillospiraceae bacterium]
MKLFEDDDQISDYARQSVYYMAKMGIINGVDDTHFAPQNTTDEQEAPGYATATREQAIALSLRIYKLADLWK